MSVQELDAEIIREFVEKIIVYKAERVDGHRVQKSKSSGIVSANFKHRHLINKNGIVQ